MQEAAGSDGLRTASGSECSLARDRPITVVPPARGHADRARQALIFSATAGGHRLLLKESGPIRWRAVEESEACRGPRQALSRRRVEDRRMSHYLDNTGRADALSGGVR